jgi:inner membrane protein
MATIYTHAVVGLGLARMCSVRPMPWAYWALAAILPILPDLDVFSSAAYGAPLGHRGITHSLALAVAVGMLAGLATFRYFRVKWWLLCSLLAAIIASHGLLDAMTKGGEGIPFFWPLASRLGNWGPIPVSDLGCNLSDLWQSRALRAEALWVWLPLGVVVSLVMAERRARQSASPEVDQTPTD